MLVPKECTVSCQYSLLRREKQDSTCSARLHKAQCAVAYSNYYVGHIRLALPRLQLYIAMV